MAVVISIENLGKSYMIGHQETKSHRYVALRDVMADGVSKWWSRIRHPEYYTHKNIEEFWALKNINLKIEQGDRLGIIGRNGAGKSTLLKLLSRITEPTTGQIKIKGHVASLLEVGTGFHPELTGRENIYLNGAILGMTRQDVRLKFDEIVDFAGVEQFLDTPVKRYSSGMYVRLGFAVAAHMESEILLVDEVLAVGDISFQKKCLGKIGSVTNDGRTVIFVSHQMSAIKELCNKAIQLDNGILVNTGSADSVVKEYIISSNNNVNNTSISYKIKTMLPAQLISLSLLNEAGFPVPHLNQGETGKARVEYIFRENIKNANVAVGLSSMDEITIWRTFDTDYEPKLLENRTLDSHVRLITLPTALLRSGNYYLAGSIGVANTGPIDRQWQNGINFQILPGNNKQLHSSQKEGRPGILNFASQWQKYVPQS